MQTLHQPFRRKFCIGVAATAGLALTGCGVILHPERKGQVDGEIDISIVALDAIGLLFFLIPGAIAFAVDFVTGTIYLPSGKKNLSDAKTIQLDKNAITAEQIEQQIKQATGEHISLSSAAVQVRRADDKQWRSLQQVLNTQQYAQFMQNAEHKIRVATL